MDVPRGRRSVDDAGPRRSIAELARDVAAQFEVALGNPEVVETAGREIRRQLGDAPAAPDLAPLLPLLPLLRTRVGPPADRLFAFLDALVPTLRAPWSFLEGMLAAGNAGQVRSALETTRRLAASGALDVDSRVLTGLAGLVDRKDARLQSPESLEILAEVLASRPAPPAGEPPSPADLYAHPRAVVRRLAARILDRPGEPAGRDLAERVLGREAYAFLAPFLAYSRATHLDVLSLVAAPGSVPALASLRRAGEAAGDALLRDVLTELGWPAVSLGIVAHPYRQVSVGGSHPFVVSPTEAALLERCQGAQTVSRGVLFTAHGGDPGDGPRPGGDRDPVARFRAYNLIHAEALADFLEVAPLTREKVDRILGLMDRIVDGFTGLFESHTEETRILPEVYAELKSRVLRELERETATHQLSAELTRLVQMFDDPGSLGDVQTLHGLKRYLHQRGLRLGFRLMKAGEGTNRTLALVAAPAGQELRAVRNLRYVDFGSGSEETGAPGTAGPEPGIPYPAAVVADGFGRQLLAGQDRFPGVDIFCYGNEVHYFLSFGAHPAFLRVDYSPPVKGGMIDLEYYGVSKNDLSVHPGVALDGIQAFFQRLEFDVQIDSTHVHARYDKERALDLEEIRGKVEALFRLAPYLMDVDWALGSLERDEPARRATLRDWVEFFAVWGVVPLKRPAAGDGSPPTVADLRGLREELEPVGKDVLPLLGEAEVRTVGQLQLEPLLLEPLRNALASGEMEPTPTGPRPVSSRRFRREHEAERLAAILAGPARTLAAAAAVADLVAPLEKTLRFRTTGSVNGYEVQRARLVLRNAVLTLFVLRDAEHLARLAGFVWGDVLYHRKRSPSEAWESSGSVDAAALASLLRAGNYLDPGRELPPPRAAGDLARLRDRLRTLNPAAGSGPAPGECAVPGFRAAPGRAVGPMVFGTRGRSPADCAGAILVSPSIRPEDSPFLYRAAGVVSTGGGILSHAGLLAIQFGKPALIIGGRWEEEDGRPVALVLRTQEYREEERDVEGCRVSIRRDLRYREHPLSEGDLAVLDAEHGLLRVLGRSRETLALHHGLGQFAEASRGLERTTDQRAVLALRGRRVRALHQLERLMQRMGDPVLARHAVHELLICEEASGTGSMLRERAELLSRLLRNRSVGRMARDRMLEILGELVRRARGSRQEAERLVPSSVRPLEILALRLDARRATRALRGAVESLEACDLRTPAVHVGDASDLDALCLRRLGELRAGLVETLSAGADPAGGAVRRHRLRQLGELDRLLDTPAREREPFEGLREGLAREDAAARERCRGRRVLTSAAGGFELHPLVGWKAANLGEIERLGGRKLVPPWFVVTQHAFREMLETRVGRPPSGLEAGVDRNATLAEAIEAVMSRPDAGHAWKSRQIRALWEDAVLPEPLARDVIEAHRTLVHGEADAAGTGPEPGIRTASGPAGARSFLAVRSSGTEEDTETAARAGEFETFLFVHGEDLLLRSLKRAWSGLWTERAIHNRSVLGLDREPGGGGILVQRMVWSRVSGVLETVNAADPKLREMVLNAGLGLGEGVVSGTVAADHVVVSKEEDLESAPLRFTYTTGDKRERVVFDERAGFGTVLAESLYHQRLRPAIEYVELCDLVRTASRLERAYGYPLDIEFAIEGTRLWILQARPIPSCLSVLDETVEHEPLVRGAAPVAGERPASVLSAKEASS